MNVVMPVPIKEFEDNIITGHFYEKEEEVFTKFQKTMLKTYIWIFFSYNWFLSSKNSIPDDSGFYSGIQKVKLMVSPSKLRLEDIKFDFKELLDFLIVTGWIKTYSDKKIISIQKIFLTMFQRINSNETSTKKFLEFNTINLESDEISLRSKKTSERNLWDKNSTFIVSVFPSSKSPSKYIAINIFWLLFSHKDKNILAWNVSREYKMFKSTALSEKDSPDIKIARNMDQNIRNSFAILILICTLKRPDIEGNYTIPNEVEFPVKQILTICNKNTYLTTSNVKNQSIIDTLCYVGGILLQSQVCNSFITPLRTKEINKDTLITFGLNKDRIKNSYIELYHQQFKVMLNEEKNEIEPRNVEILNETTKNDEVIYTGRRSTLNGLYNNLNQKLALRSYTKETFSQFINDKFIKKYLNQLQDLNDSFETFYEKSTFKFTPNSNAKLNNTEIYQKLMGNYVQTWNSYLERSNEILSMNCDVFDELVPEGVPTSCFNIFNHWLISEFLIQIVNRNQITILKRIYINTSFPHKFNLSQNSCILTEGGFKKPIKSKNKNLGSTFYGLSKDIKPYVWALTPLMLFQDSFAVSIDIKSSYMAIAISICNNYDKKEYPIISVTWDNVLYDLLNSVFYDIPKREVENISKTTFTRKRVKDHFIILLSGKSLKRWKFAFKIYQEGSNLPKWFRDDHKRRLSTWFEEKCCLLPYIKKFVEISQGSSIFNNIIIKPDKKGSIDVSFSLKIIQFAIIQQICHGLIKTGYFIPFTIEKDCLVLFADKNHFDLIKNDSQIQKLVWDCFQNAMISKILNTNGIDVEVKIHSMPE